MLDANKVYQRASGRVNQLIVELHLVGREINDDFPDDKIAKELANNAKVALEDYRRYLIKQTYCCDQ